MGDNKTCTPVYGQKSVMILTNVFYVEEWRTGRKMEEFGWSESEGRRKFEYYKQEGNVYNKTYKEGQTLSK